MNYLYLLFQYMCTECTMGYIEKKSLLYIRCLEVEKKPTN